MADRDITSAVRTVGEGGYCSLELRSEDGRLQVTHSSLEIAELERHLAYVREQWPALTVTGTWDRSEQLRKYQEAHCE